jgi:hypothetical protein
MTLARSLVAVAGVVLLAQPADAQAPAETALRQALEGRRVTVKIDLPGSSDGVDVRTDGPFDARQYGDRLKKFGTSIRAGEGALVTRVKLKGDLIEFQLDGGGFGTAGDDYPPAVNMPFVEKSNREKDLEKRVKTEQDPARRKQLERDLSDLRESRDRENRRIASERTLAEAYREHLIALRRLEGGSRINVHYEARVPADVTADDLMQALRAYVDFTSAPPEPGADVATASAPTATPDTAMSEPALRKGMLRAEVERKLGTPKDASDRREGQLVVTTLVFQRGDERIAAEFVEGVLIRYTITVR